MAAIYSGDDLALQVTVTKDGAVLAVSGGATVRAALIHAATKEVIGPAACDSGATGADWDNGVIVAEFAAADTVDMLPGPQILEIEILDGTLTTVQVTDIYAHRAYITNA